MRDLIEFLEDELNIVTGKKSKAKIQSWIRMLKALFPDHDKEDVEAHLRAKHKNNTRSEWIIGVTRRIKLNSIGGENIYWIARAKGTDRILTRAFNVKKYGEKEAFMLACIARHNWAGTLMVKSFKKLPCKPPVPYEMVKK